MPDTNVLSPTSAPNPADAVQNDVAKESKEKIAVDTLHNVLNEVMTALKRIGENVDNINKRVDALEKSINVKVIDDKISVEGKKDEKPKSGDYKTDTVEFAKSSTKVPATTNESGGVNVDPDVQIIKAILTADKGLSAEDIYYKVKKTYRGKWW